MDRTDTYCRDIVVRHDYDRYVLAQAAPAPLRPALYALFAFHHEIAKTRDVVRDTHAGLIRLAWWGEALEGFMQGQPMPNHEVAEALGRAIKAHDLPVELLGEVIDARRTEQEDITPATLEGMADFADICNTPLLTAACLLNGERPEYEPLRALATAWGIIGQVRAIPYMAARKRCYLPATMVYELGIMPEQFDHLEPSAKLNTLVECILARAQALLSEAKGQGALFKRQKQLARFYMKRIADAGYNPFDVRVCTPVPFLGMRILFQDQ
ncbi:MAG: squalene/phytoene synthase family protein [Alphaproteobacteria bacterium]|nr:squalene/phytoene synthase family protein [Alphaproteobacteria bacterium]